MIRFLSFFQTYYFRFFPLHRPPRKKFAKHIEESIFKFVLKNILIYNIKIGISFSMIFKIKTVIPGSNMWHEIQLQKSYFIYQFEKENLLNCFD